MTTIKAAILYILQLKRMLREEANITAEEQGEVVEEKEELADSEVRDEKQEERNWKTTNVSLESTTFQHSPELKKLPPMTVLKPPRDIQYLDQVVDLRI